MLFGLEAAAEAFDQSGAEGFEPIAAEGEWRDDVPADVGVDCGPGTSPARGRAHRAQPARPPVRRRDADGALRRGRRGIRRTGPRHPQDDPRPARAREGGRCRRWRDQPPHGPPRRDPDQGEPRRDRRRGRPRPSRAPGEAQPGMAVEVECRDAAEVAAALEAGRRPPAARQHGRRRAARRRRRARRSSGETAPSSRHRAASPSTTRPRWPPPAWTSSRSARSRTRRRRSTSACCVEPGVGSDACRRRRPSARSARRS